MFDLIFFDDIVFVDGFHGKDFFGFFSLDKEDGSKGSSSEYNFRGKVIKSDFLFEIFFGEQGFGSPPNHFPFLLFSFQILFITDIIMHHIITLNLFGAFFLFFFLSRSIVNQTQLILIIDGQFVVLYFPVGLQDVIYDLLSSV